MRYLKRLDVSADAALKVCIARIRCGATKAKLSSAIGHVLAGESDYITKAEVGRLDLIPQVGNIGSLPGKELIKTYDNRMAKIGQPGRHIYDRIKSLPENDECPFCGHRNVSTVDHVLPKAHYPMFSVAPVNLVACCSDCNKMRSDVIPVGADNGVLHPYFDQVDGRQWLFARVVTCTPAAIEFSVRPVVYWADELNKRVRHQFQLLGLPALYSAQAAREMAHIRRNLKRHFEAGGMNAVREELKYQWSSRRANRLNSWQAATYEALWQSDWFCDGGFGQA